MAGRAKGKLEGREEGINIGIEKIAINMLRQKLDESLIANVTGLSLEEILKLKQNL